LTHEAPTQELGADKHGLSSSAKHVQTGQAGKKSKVRRSFWTGKEKPPLETAGEYNARIAEQKAKIPPPLATDLPPPPQRGGVEASGGGPSAIAVAIVLALFWILRWEGCQSSQPTSLKEGAIQQELKDSKSRR